MSEETKLPLWSKEREAICREIRSTTGLIKIVLKTKNEAHLLQSWIDHHVQIAGPKNVIIMDNCSDDPAVLDIYERNSNSVSLYAYGGHHNSLHRISVFPELYQSLRDSCSFYIFIDTDEFLFWSTDRKLVSDKLESKHLETPGPNDVFPGIWLHNYPGCRDIFFVNDHENRAIEGLTWGKPLIASSLNVEGFINHNCQLKGSVPTIRPRFGLFVAHFNRLIPQQRIAQNIQKLISRKTIKSVDDLEELLRADTPANPDGNVDLYVREIKSLRSLGEAGWPKLNNPPTGTIKLLDDGDIVYFDENVRQAFVQIETGFESSWSKVQGVSG
jgi:Glycosyl transferase family 2